jgi:hypothetical protein
LGPGGGNGNVAVGSGALATVASGYQNIGIGLNAGDGISTGANNIAIGPNSDVSAGVHTAVAIGSGAVASQNFAIVLGDALNSEVKVGIGTSTPSEKLTVVGNVFVTGNLTATTLTQSDRRLKTQIARIVSPLEVLQKIEGVSYYWTAKDDKSKQYGVIAQEIEKVLPEIVKTNEAGVKAVNYTALIPFLVEAIKQQQKQIDELKNENGQLAALLQTEVAKLHDKVNTLNSSAASDKAQAEKK